MANDNIKRYLDYDGLVYLINKFNSVIEANEQTTSEAINDLNQKIEELTDNTGGFPIIDADITQVDSVYTTTENLNELITPGQYIIDSSKIQYEDDTFIKTLYWLLSVDRVVYDNNESIVQTYYPLSYLSYKWFNIPVGGLLQRFYEGNNTWTDLQIAAPGDIDPNKYVTQIEFNETIETLVSKTEFNETITPYAENIKIIEISENIFNTTYSSANGDYTITKGNTTPIDNLFDPGIYYIKYNNLNTDNVTTFNAINYVLHVLEANINSSKYITQIFELYNPAQFYGNPRSLRFCRYYDPSTQTWSDVYEIAFSKELTNTVIYNTAESTQSGEEPSYIEPEEEFIYVLKDPITTGDDKDMSMVLTGYGDSQRIELKIHKSYSMPTKNYVINNYVSNQTFNDYVDSRYKIINSTEALFNISNNNNIWQVSNISNNVIDNITEEGLYQINYSNVDLGGSNFNGPVFIMSVQKTYNGTVTQHFNVVGLGIISILTGQKLSFIRYYENGNIAPSEPTGWAEPIILNEDKEINNIKLNGGLNVPTDEQFVSVVSNSDISLNYDASGRGFYATLPAVQIPTQKYIDENFIPKSESTNIWDAIHEGSVNSISLEKSGVTKTTTDEEVDIPYIENVVDFKEGSTGSFTGTFDVISLPTKNYVINNYVSNQTLSTALNDYVSNQTLSTTLNDYVSKSSYIPNILKNGTPQAYGEKDSSLQWYRTSNAITDTNSTDFNDICAPSYSDFDETSASFNINSMVIRAFWNYAYFHDIWMSPNSDSILHRSINNNVAKPWKILLDNENCGKYVKNVIKDSVDTNQIIINNGFNCNPYANFRSSIGIYNSRHIELVSKAQSKLPSESNNNYDLGTDAGDIIFYKNVGKTYKNPDDTEIEQWPDFVSGKPSGSFTEHYGPMEICRIYATYTAADRCILNIRRAAGLVEEGNPQNQYVNAEIVDSSTFNYFLQQNNVITTSNIASNLPSTVITTNNISHIEFKPSSGATNGGFIDFHYGGSTVDFTSRIIEDSQGTITVSSSILKATGKLTAASIDVTGNINVGGGVYETSDETLKDFQDSIQVNFEQLKEIPKAYFTFKDDKSDEVKIGTSAQKVKEFYPELVSENNEGILSVDYAKLSMVALKAVDILDDRITKLEKLVEQLLENK